MVVRVELQEEGDAARWTRMMNVCVAAEYRAWELEAVEAGSIPSEVTAHCTSYLCESCDEGLIKLLCDSSKRQARQ